MLSFHFACRKIIIDAILHTDMTHHFSTVAKVRPSCLGRPAGCGAFPMLALWMFPACRAAFGPLPRLMSCMPAEASRLLLRIVLPWHNPCML